MMSNFDPHKIEKEISKFWKDNNTYKKAKKANIGKKSFYFLDGPPYTSGHVHIGTAWNKSLKDTVLRYFRMAGRDVWDRAGYDMHGLPTARKVQAKLNLETKEDIEKYGIAKFIIECKRFALENMGFMNEEFQSLGVWMDFDNAYMPITKEYIEGEWWLIKQAEKNKRLYQAEKTMHWCKSCSTALAKHELEYHNVKEDSIFVKLQIKDKPGEYLVIWTTTPWTIPFNMGVMVHPELDYVRIEVEGEIWIVSAGLCAPFLNAVVGKPYKVIEEFKGEELEGLKYVHPQTDEIDFFKKIKNKKVHTVVLSRDYVDLSAGTGLVHMAPGCGPEDYEVGHKEGIPPFNSLQEDGVFPESMGKFSGLTAKKDDGKFIEDLESRGALIATTKVEHDYAHCWRCKDPVIFRTTKQWFFKVEDLIEDLKKENEKIKWEPAWAGQNWFDSWLTQLRDNSITRQRYWGTPLPIWQCEKCNAYDVIGTVKELEKKAGFVPKDLHKPYIDKCTWKCKCGGTMIRSPDILDVWIDAGTSSWNCLDFPATKKNFEKLFPADFILEGKDQIRGWFNLLLVSSMVAMKKPSFKACYMHGFIQDSKGRKMSKSLGNIISPQEVIKDFGADAFRFYSIGGANAGLDLNYNADDVKTKYRSLGVLWNVHNYLLGYVNFKKKGKEDLVERYILSKLNSTIKEVTELFNNYKIDKIPGKVEELFLELSRSYIQFTREKLIVDPGLVAETIGKVLVGSLKLLAPITPFASEAMWQNLRKPLNLKEESVHLCKWPKADERVIDKKLEESMGLATGFIGAILAAREKANRGIRWPVIEATIIPNKKEFTSKIKPLISLMEKHTNVKSIVTKQTFKVNYAVKANFKTLGKKYGAEVRDVEKLIAKENPAKLVGKATAGKFKLGKYELDGDDLVIEEHLPGDYQMGECHYGRVYLNTELTKELEKEGLARELMRRVQDLRKKAGLKKEDKVELDVSDKMFKNFSSQIKLKCGVSKLSFGENKFKHKGSFEIIGKKFVISLKP